MDTARLPWVPAGNRRLGVIKPNAKSKACVVGIANSWEQPASRHLSLTRDVDGGHHLAGNTTRIYRKHNLRVVTEPDLKMSGVT